MGYEKPKPDDSDDHPPGYGHGVGASTDCCPAGEIGRHALDTGGLGSTGAGGHRRDMSRWRTTRLWPWISDKYLINHKVGDGADI